MLGALVASVAIHQPTRADALNVLQLGLIVNENDPTSVEIASYYQAKRGVPAENVVRVKAPVQASIDRHQFRELKEKVEAQLPPVVQVLAIAWTLPSRVECNSLTSAFARGFEAAPCENNTCNFGNPSPYYDSESRQPFTDFGMRPAMMLAGWTVQDVKSLIDRGVASDGTDPKGSAVILNKYAVRGIRAKLYQAGEGHAISPFVNVRILEKAFISGTTDTLFYFTGSVSVPDIASNVFPPGAVADNLTSAGGMLTDSGQMSALEFVKGPSGATGTFGTVSEPCAWPSKFPNPAILIRRYTDGETLIEAYWKSVEQTFQGAFVGEPLARPWTRRVDSNPIYRNAEVTAGKTIPLGVLSNVSRECEPAPSPEIKVKMPPKHGILTIRSGKAKAGALARCPNLAAPLQAVLYQSEARYSGPDQVSFEIRHPNGRTQSITMNITVTVQARPGATPPDGATEP